jgi:hypothetical protein
MSGGVGAATKAVEQCDVSAGLTTTELEKLMFAGDEFGKACALVSNAPSSVDGGGGVCSFSSNAPV